MEWILEVEKGDGGGLQGDKVLLVVVGVSLDFVWNMTEVKISGWFAKKINRWITSFLTFFQKLLG